MVNVDLSGKIAVVSGATGQLGRVIVRTLAKAGADIAVHYHSNEQKAAELCEELRGCDIKAVPVKADVTSLDSVLEMRDRIVEELGKPDIIVNNAVSQYQWKPILEQDIEDYEDQFKSCVLHNVNMIKAFVPFMVEKNRGKVIGINTECAMQNMPGQSAYVAGKRGMDGVMRVLAREVGRHNINVNQVAPGWMITEKNRDTVGTATHNIPNYMDYVALGHRGQDQDIANAVLFLASELSDFITGVYLPVCGGFVMPAI